MKSYNKFLIAIFTFMLIGIFFLVKTTLSYQSEKRDTLFTNDLVQSIKESEYDLRNFDNSDFDTELLIFNSEDFLVFSDTDRELANINSLEDAMNNSCICLAVKEGSRFIGTAVIPNPDKAGFDSNKQRIIRLTLLIVLMMIIVGSIYGVYVEKNIIQPFKKMEEFASDVANGKLDEPLKLKKNNMFGSFTQSFDIMREQLKASRKRENELHLKEKEMVASLSHDLKTPVTGIKLICELLLVKVQDDYIKDKIGNISQKAEQINILASNLFSSALDDLSEMEVSCCDENSMILHQLIAEHDTRNLTQESEIPQCMVKIDRLRLSQVIGNIIINSYKYADTPIDVNYRIKGEFLEMSLHDYGEGISEEELPFITQKFYRGKSNSVGKDGGGLGLYIANELMAKMDGELVCSCGGKGLTVTLIMPLS